MAHLTIWCNLTTHRIACTNYPNNCSQFPMQACATMKGQWSKTFAGIFTACAKAACKTNCTHFTGHHGHSFRVLTMRVYQHGDHDFVSATCHRYPFLEHRNSGVPRVSGTAFPHSRQGCLPLYIVFLFERDHFSPDYHLSIHCSVQDMLCCHVSCLRSFSMC